MPYRNRHRSAISRSEIIAASLEDREDEMLDAVITAAVLVANADGRIDTAEREQLLDFLRRKGFLSIFTRQEVLSSFESCTRELRDLGATEAAVERLSRLAGRSPDCLAELGPEIAAADGRLDPREQRVLEMIRTVSGSVGRGSEPESDPVRGSA